MVLLPGCACCLPPCFLSAPYPEYIEVDVTFDNASGIGTATQTRKDKKYVFLDGGWFMVEERTRTTVHTTAPASGAYTIRLTHVGSGLFSSPTGDFLSATVTGGEIRLVVTPAVCDVQASEHINKFFFSGPPTSTSTSSTFSNLTRNFVCRFGCFGVTVVPGTNSYFFPRPYDSIGVSLFVPNRQFCAGTSFEFADRNMTVSKSAESMFPFTVSHRWSGSHAKDSYTEDIIESKLVTDISTVNSYGSMSTYPPLPSYSAVVNYGFTTNTSFSDIRVKLTDGEPFSIASAFDASRPSHGGSQGFERANCAEWLLIS